MSSAILQLNVVIRQIFVQVLLELVSSLHFFHGFDQGCCTVGRGCVGDMQVNCSPSDLVAVFGCSFSKGCVDDPGDITILDLVKNMRPSLGNLIDLLTVYHALLQEQRGATGGKNGESEILSAPWQPVQLTVCHCRGLK